MQQKCLNLSDMFIARLLHDMPFLWASYGVGQIDALEHARLIAEEALLPMKGGGMFGRQAAQTRRRQ